MPQLQIELDICGPELMLVVSRFDIKETDGSAESTLEDMAMEWNDIGAGASHSRTFLKRKRVCFEDDQHDDGGLYDMNGQSPMPGRETQEFELESQSHNASAEYRSQDETLITNNEQSETTNSVASAQKTKATSVDSAHSIQGDRGGKANLNGISTPHSNDVCK